jgi:hypothetical protein
MTWTGKRAFRSGFYFSRVRSPKVDLEFTIEGREPVWLTHLTAHAHPDAIYREFEDGLVLANPAPREYTFRLGTLLAGKTFRRLAGSSKQDPKTNDGSAVTETLTLEDRAGLFLIRTGKKR